MMSTPSSARPIDEYWNDDFRPLQDAGKGILSMLRRDETSAHGDLYRRIISNTPTTTTTTTTTNNGDVESNPAHHYFTPDQNDSTVQHVETIPLPSGLQEKRKNARISTMMGLFPQGELAWLTVDDTVHLWTYHTSIQRTTDRVVGMNSENQILEFQMPSKQPIVSVGLAPPKPGTCSSTINQS